MPKALVGLEPATTHWLAAAEEPPGLEDRLPGQPVRRAPAMHVGATDLRAAPALVGGGLVSLSSPSASHDRDLGVHPRRSLGDARGLDPDRATPFVSRVARTAPNSFKLDQTFIANLLPYAVPVVGFVLTAFPSLGYWIGSLLGPIGRAVK